MAARVRCAACLGLAVALLVPAAARLESAAVGAQAGASRVYLPVVGRPTTGAWSGLSQLGGQTGSLALDARTAYVNVGTRVTAVDLESGSRLGESAPLPVAPSGLALAGGWLYGLVDEPGGPPALVVFDIRERGRPLLSAQVPLADAERTPPELTPVGEVLVLRLAGRLELWSAARAELPQRVSTIRSPRDFEAAIGARGFLFGVAWQSDGSGGHAVLDVFDLSQPDRPRALALGVPLPSAQTGPLAIAGQWLAMGLSGKIMVIDVGQPTAPRWLADLPCAGSVDLLWAGDNRLWAVTHGADPENIAQRLLLSGAWDPAAPPLDSWLFGVSELGTEGTATFGPGRLALAHRCRGARAELELVDLARPAERRSAVLDDSGGLGSPTPDGDRLFLLAHACTGQPVGLRVFDIAQPDRPRSLGQVDLPGDGPILGLVARAGVAYLGSMGGLFVVDAREPGPPRLVRRLDGWPGQLVGEGDRLYVVGEAVHVLDIARAGEPRELGRMPNGPPPDHFRDVWRGILVGVRECQESSIQICLWLLDARDPTNIRRAGEVDVGMGHSSIGSPLNFMTLRVVDGVAYTQLGAYSHAPGIVYPGVHAVDVRDPSRPRLLADPPEMASVLRIVGAGDGRLFATGLRAGAVTSYDLDGAGRVLGAGSLPVDANEVVSDGDRLFAVQRDGPVPFVTILVP